MICFGSIVLAAPVIAPKNPFNIGNLTRNSKSNLIAYQDNTLGQTIGKIARRNENLAIIEEIRRKQYITTSEDKVRLKQQIVDISTVYGIDPEKIKKTIECESNYNRWAVGDQGAAFGIAQFHWPTFERYCHGNYYSAEDQINCMVEMIAKGGQKNWTCFTKLYGI